MSSKRDWAGLGIREVAALLSAKLREHGLDAVLVGGACVSIYSANAYESFDIDFVSFEEDRRIKSALEELGFKKGAGRHYDHPRSRYYAEFLAPPVAVGREQVKRFKRLRTPLGQIKMLTPTDCVKDRLAAYIHWKDAQSLRQAALVAKAQGVSWKSIHAWAVHERALGAVRDLKQAMKEAKLKP